MFTGDIHKPRLNSSLLTQLHTALSLAHSSGWTLGAMSMFMKEVTQASVSCHLVEMAHWEQLMISDLMCPIGAELRLLNQ